MQTVGNMTMLIDQMGRLEQSQRRMASDMQTGVDSGVEVSIATSLAQTEAKACRKIIIQLGGKVRTLQSKRKAGHFKVSSAAPEVTESVSRRIQFLRRRCSARNE